MKYKKLLYPILTGILAYSCSDSSSDEDTSTGGGDDNTKEECPTDETCAYLSGTYTEDMILTSDTRWILSGGVFIGNDNQDSMTLTIEAGTKIVGEGDKDFLVINRGSKIEAVGTRENPIVFTSGNNEGERNRGDWGGLIINGNAPINGCNAGVCEAEGEGNTGLYGGDKADDNSGSLKYVRVEFAGREISEENELNGIAFQGVGSATEVDYVQVHMNLDDGVEFFGGTVNVKHLVLTANRDDSLDWVNGWQGKGQFIYIKQSAGTGDNGIEADSLKDDPDAEPRSNPTLANLTLMGSGDDGSGMLFRRGTAVSLYNSIVGGFPRACLHFDDEFTYEAELVKIYNTLLGSCGLGATSLAETETNLEDFFLAMPGNKINDSFSLTESTYSELVEEGQALPNDGFFEQVDYRGAIKDSDSDWTSGWTTDAAN